MTGVSDYNGPHVNSWVCDRLSELITCYSSDYYLRTGHSQGQRCATGHSLGPDQHCYDMNNLLVGFLLVLYALYFGKRLPSVIRALANSGLGDLSTPSGLTRLSLNLWFLLEMWGVYAMLIALLSLFTDWSPRSNGFGNRLHTLVLEALSFGARFGLLFSLWATSTPYSLGWYVTRWSLSMLKVSKSTRPVRLWTSWS